MKSSVAPSVPTSASRALVSELNTPGPGHAAGTKDLAAPRYPLNLFVGHRGDVHLGQREPGTPFFEVHPSYRRDPHAERDIAWEWTAIGMRIFTVAAAIALGALVVIAVFHGASSYAR